MISLFEKEKEKRKNVSISGVEGSSPGMARGQIKELGLAGTRSVSFY